MTKCRNCGAEAGPDDAFCGACGADMAGGSAVCPACGKAVAEEDRHCAFCGAALETPAEPAPVRNPEPVPEEKICADCRHFRDVIPLSPKLPVWDVTMVSQALIKIEEDQVKQSAAEASHRAYLIETGNTRWNRRPIMSAFCAASAAQEMYEVCEVKNRELNCPDYAVRTGSESDCRTCLYFVGRKQKPFPPQSGLTAELWEKRWEAIGSEIALEITALWASKGEPHGNRVVHHDFCALFNKALPYINIHKDCDRWIRNSAESKMFSDMRKRRKKKKHR